VNLRATVTLADIHLLLEQATPLRVHGKDEWRWIEINRPSEVELVAGRGLRVTTNGRVRLGRGDIQLPVRIKTITLSLTPSVREGRLAASVEVEALDVAFVPGVVDEVVRSAVNKALAPLESNLAWAVGKTLRASKQIPPRLEPLELLLLETQRLDLVVEEDRVVLDVALAANVTRAADRAVARAENP
jgi:hypothetical protein